MIKAKVDLSGRRFGRLTVLRQGDDYITGSGKKRSAWICVCDCGKAIKVIGYNLLSGNTSSCGCLADEHRKYGSISHNGRHTRLYRIWTNMKSRCTNPNFINYSDYGGRGIKVCDSWNTDFASFREWAYKNGYEDSLSIDRIDNDLGYFPENCRWVGAKEQAGNRRSNKYIEVDGRTHSLAEWADMLGYSRSIFHARAKLYQTTIEEEVAKKYHEKYSH